MNSYSKELRDGLPVSLTNPANTVTFGYWPFQKLVGFVQTMNRTENEFGNSGTNRPFVQKRIGLIGPNTLIGDIYAHGVRPLASVLVDAEPAKKPYALQTYNGVPGQIDETWPVKTDVDSIWEMHQDKKYRQMAINTTEAILAKRRNGIGNPVVLEHAGELNPQLLTNLLDTINVLSIGMDPKIATISAISTPSLDSYNNADLVVKDTSVPITTSLYPSYIVNRVGKEEEIVPGHYSMPPFKQTSGVSGVYDRLHESAKDWVKNHTTVFNRNS